MNVVGHRLDVDHGFILQTPAGEFHCINYADVVMSVSELTAEDVAQSTVYLPLTDTTKPATQFRATAMYPAFMNIAVPPAFGDTVSAQVAIKEADLPHPRVPCILHWPGYRIVCFLESTKTGSDSSLMTLMFLAVETCFTFHEMEDPDEFDLMASL